MVNRLSVWYRKWSPRKDIKEREYLNVENFESTQALIGLSDIYEDPLTSTV